MTDKPESSRRRSMRLDRESAVEPKLRAVRADERAAAATPVKYTEVHAAERLAKYLRGKYCYSPGLGWMWWNSNCWEHVPEEDVTDVARKRHRAWYSMAYARAANGVSGPTLSEAWSTGTRGLARAGRS